MRYALTLNQSHERLMKVEHMQLKEKSIHFFRKEHLMFSRQKLRLGTIPIPGCQPKGREKILALLSMTASHSSAQYHTHVGVKKSIIYHQN